MNKKQQALKDDENVDWESLELDEKIEDLHISIENITRTINKLVSILEEHQLVKFTDGD